MYILKLGGGVGADGGAQSVMRALALGLLSFTRVDVILHWMFVLIWSPQRGGGQSDWRDD